MRSVFYIILLLAGSAFFSGTEIAYNNLNKLKMKKESDSEDRTSRLVKYLYKHYDSLLATLLIGNNLVNIGSTAIATVLAVTIAGLSSGRLTNSSASTVSTVVMTVLILIFGEITPKIIGSRRSESITRIASYPLLLLMILFSPLVFITTGFVNFCSRLWIKPGAEDVTVTEADLENILDTVEDEGVIDEDDADLLQSALEFSELEAGDILTPRIDVIGLEVNDSIEHVLQVFEETQFSRFPVYEKTIDHIIGILYVKHLLKALAEGQEVTLRDLMLDPVFIPRSMSLDVILNQFRKEQIHMAVVADEYGGTAGIVTMEDVLEQLVGEIWDENDEIVNDWQKITDTRFECSGDMNLSDFFENLDMDDRDLDTDCTTVSGWTAEQIGAVPIEFDAFDYKNITVIVREVDDNHRATRLIVLVHKTGQPEE